MGEWLYRAVQRPAQGRTSRRGNLLLPRRGEDSHRELAAPLQHRAAAWIAGLQAAGARSLRASHGRAGGCATSASFAARSGLKANNALTFQPDHSVVAGHVHPADPAFGRLQLQSDVIDASAAPRGAQKFPFAASVRIILSSVRSETARRSRAFSASRFFNRFT